MFIDIVERWTGLKLRTVSCEDEQALLVMFAFSLVAKCGVQIVVRLYHKYLHLCRYMAVVE